MQRVKRAELGTSYQPIWHCQPILRHRIANRYHTIGIINRYSHWYYQPTRKPVGMITRSANRASLITVAYGNLHYGLADAPRAFPTRFCASPVTASLVMQRVKRAELRFFYFIAIDGINNNYHWNATLEYPRRERLNETAFVLCGNFLNAYYITFHLL